MDSILTKNYVAGGTISARRFAKPGASDGAVLQAAAASDNLFGVTADLGASAGQRVDVIHVGIAELELGGTVTRGYQLTSDASGRGVQITTAGQRVGAIALQSGVSGDIVRVLLMGGIAGNQANAIADASFVVGAEVTNTINVAVQLKDALGADLAVRGSVFAYLSDDAHGDSIVATAPSGGWAIGTDGLLIPVVANKAAQFISEADGDIDVTITEAGAKTCYMVVVLPNGTLKVSNAITFAA